VRQLLAEIYGWFTEGFDMADLLEVKAHLEELKQESSCSARNTKIQLDTHQRWPRAGPARPLMARGAVSKEAWEVALER
jgi:hypothetical protein